MFYKVAEAYVEKDGGVTAAAAVKKGICDLKVHCSDASSCSATIEFALLAAQNAAAAAASPMYST